MINLQDNKFTNTRTSCLKDYDEHHELQDIVNEGLAASGKQIHFD